MEQIWDQMIQERLMESLMWLQNTIGNYGIAIVLFALLWLVYQVLKAKGVSWFRIFGWLCGLAAGVLVARENYRLLGLPYVALFVGWYTSELVYPHLAGILSQPNRLAQIFYFVLLRLVIAPMFFLLALYYLHDLQNSAAVAFLAILVFEFLFNRLAIRLFPTSALKAQIAVQLTRGRLQQATVLQTRLRDVHLKTYRRNIQKADQIRIRKPTTAQQRYQDVIRALGALPKRTDEENQCLARAYLGLGHVWESAGKQREAIDSYSKAKGFGLGEATLPLAPLLACQKKYDEGTFKLYIEYLCLLHQMKDAKPHQMVLAALEIACQIKEGDSGLQLDRAMQRCREVIQADAELAWAHHYLGVGYLQTRQPQEALAALTQARRLEPKRAATHAYLGQAYLLIGQPDTAINALQKSLDLDPNQPATAFQLAQLFLLPLLKEKTVIDASDSTLQERANLALKWLKHAIHLDQKKNAYFYYLGRAYLLCRTYQEAQAAFEKAISLSTHPQKEYFYYTALAQKALNQISQAKETVNKALSLDKDYAEAHHLLADLYFSEQAFQSAAHHYSEVVRLDGKNFTARRLWGRSLYEVGDYRQTIVELTPIADQFQDALFYQARAQSRLGEFKIAANNLQKCVTIFGATADIQYFLGCAYANLGQMGQSEYFDKALAGFAQCVEIDPTYWKAHLQSGHVHLTRGQLLEAQHRYQQALAAQPHNATILYALGQAAFLQGDKVQAQATFEQALQQTPNYQPAHTALGILYEQQGQLPKALQAYQSAGNHRALGMLHCKQGSYNKAQESLRQAQANGDDSDALLNYLGFVLAQSNQPEQALAVWNKLKTRHNNDLDLGQNIGRLYYLVGHKQAKASQYTEAAQSWEQYLKIFSTDNQVRLALAEVYFRVGIAALHTQNGTNENHQAKQAFKRAMDLADDNTYAYHLALCELENQEYPACIARLRRLQQNEPDCLEYAYHLGLALLNQNQLSEAHTLLQRVLVKTEDGELKRKAHWSLAGLYMRQQEWQKAADLFSTPVL